MCRDSSEPIDKALGVQELIADIYEKRTANLSSKIQRYPRKNLIASDISDCDRYLYYSVENWQDRPLQDVSLQGLFDAGNQEERNIIRDLIDLGYNVMQQQTPFEIKDIEGNKICSGKVDGKIYFKKVVYPFEIKLMNDNVFNTIKSVEDLQKKPYHRKYLRQLQLYLYGHNHEQGFFIISNGRGQWKLLPMALDYGLCETILQRVERVAKALKAKVIPEKIDYNNQLCDTCAFMHICLQDKLNTESKFIDNPELEDTLDRREFLKPLAKEYEELDDTIKSTFKGVPEAFVGKNYQIISKEQNRSSVDSKAMPEDLRKQYTVQTKVWITKILKI